MAVINFVIIIAAPSSSFLRLQIYKMQRNVISSVTTLTANVWHRQCAMLFNHGDADSGEEKKERERGGKAVAVICNDVRV